ncbi:LOW QUALITY PROTEIN: exonuclease 1-like [Sphaeramia orbicularis]|uniref:LOW QUALITY PROTEIN: exonuclease 1-like n=1 Tax=Sphaeramia orbicularis TaxID=375764 RepID=UPI00117FF5FA|nr:LOW QUALITY PROTEIN: exonuclease 1-like [Sphaeramia orbicularis]
MGIPGLLQFIKDAAEPVNVKKYKGQTVAVDTYCWLHKGAFSCAEKLAKGEPTEQYVWYCMKFVDLLLNFNVKPILVFDGRNLPSKQEVERARRQRREANLQKGRQLLREGKLSEARDCFNRCVNITPAMAHNLIKVARLRGVDCVVAPYEADAQLAFLTKSGLAQAVITEDSDLLAFGCKKVILKMDKQGNGLEIDQSHLGRCRALGNVFTEDKFRYMCILSGCDYLASLHGIGLGKACKLLRLAKEPDILKVIRKMGQYLKMDLIVPDHYIEGFVRANNTFLYQLVFDPVQRKVVPLNRYADHVDPASLSYAGPHIGDDKGLQMALGNLDIYTLEKIDDFNPDKPVTQVCKARSRSWNDCPSSSGPSTSSIWSRGFKAASAPTAGPASSPDRPPSNRGKERVISLDAVRLPCRELQVKRPREDCPLSDQDMLQQYSSSSHSRKRSKSEEQQHKPIQPRSRNCFATLLQKRNQVCEDEDQTTCSRFFSPSAGRSSNTSVQDAEPRSAGPPQSQAGPGSQTGNSDGPDAPSVETPSPPPSPSQSITPSPAGSRGLRLFQWSGTPSSTDQTGTPKPSSGLAALHKFHYKRENVSLSRPQSQSRLRDPENEETPPSQDSAYLDPEDEEASPSQDSAYLDPEDEEASPSQDSAYSSQSQPDLTSCHTEDCPTHCFPSTHHPHACTSEVNSSPDSESERSPTQDKKPSMGRSKVSGLSRPKSSGQIQTVRAGLGPSRASGLKRKSCRKTQTNNENSPGVQETISNLWTKFSYKK